MALLSEIAELLEAELDGNPELEITGIRPLESAGTGEIAFLADDRKPPAPDQLQASAVIVSHKVDRALFADRVALLRVDDPYLGFARTMNHFHEPPKPFFQGISPAASVDPSVEIGANPCIAAGVSIAPGCRIGDNVILHPGVTIAEQVEIGDDVELFPRVVLYPSTKIANRVRIHAGSVIGSDGFGYAPSPQGSLKIPHQGRVVIEDDVEIGAATAIDRGALDDTRIEKGAKIDNLVQVGHNCVVGPYSFIAGQSGLAGSCTLGMGVLLGGQVGLAGHLHIGDGAKVGAKSGVHSDIPAGETFFGYPATDLRTARRALAILYKLPELRSHVDRIGKQLENFLKDA